MSAGERKQRSGRDEDNIWDIEETESKSYKCGYVSWKPDWLQRFNHPWALLACVCWFTFTQGTLVK